MTQASAPLPTTKPKRRVLMLALWAIVGVAIVLVFHPPMLGIGDEGQKLPGWDATRVFWADLVFMRRCVLSGELPLWNPYDRAGYAFAAEPQSGVYDPITWLVVLISLPLKAAPSWLISLKALLYYALASAGIAAFSRPLDRRLPQLPNWAMFVGVLAYTVGGRMDKLKDQSGLWPSAWAPWLLVALRFALRNPSWRRGAALGLVGGLCVVSGYPPVAVRLALLLLVPLGVLWLVQAVLEARKTETMGTYLQGLWQCAVAAGLVVGGLVGAQVLATSQVLPMTMRAELPLSEVLASSVELVHGRGLLAPGEAKVSVLLYAGVATGLAVVLGCVRKPQRIESIALVVLGVFGFLLACGGNTPVLPALAGLPGFRSFRIAGHFIVLSSVATCIVAPRGLAMLFEGEDRTVAKVLAPCLALFGAAVFFRYASEPSVLGKAAVMLSAAVFAALPFLPDRARPREAAGWALALLIGLDIAAGNRPVAEILQPPPDVERPQTLAAAVEDPDNRMADFGWARNRPGPRTGTRDLVGARPALTDRHYMRLYKSAQRHPNLLAVMGVEAAAFGRSARSRSRLRALPGAEGADRAIRVVREPWPRVFFTDTVQHSKDAKRAERALRRGDARAVVFGDDAKALEPRDGGEAVALTAQFKSVNHIELDVDAPTHGLVVFNEAWDPGWQASVDGERVPIHRANLLHRAVEVGEGPHHVVLRYRPRGVRLLSLIWLVTVLGCPLVLALPTMRARSRARSDGRLKQRRVPAEDPR